MDTTSAGGGWSAADTGARTHVRRGRRLVSRELRFFRFLDVDQVSRDDPFGFAFSQRLALLEPQRAVAELLDEVE